MKTKKEKRERTVTIEYRKGRGGERNGEMKGRNKRHKRKVRGVK